MIRYTLGLCLTQKGQILWEMLSIHFSVLFWNDKQTKGKKEMYILQKLINLPYAKLSQSIRDFVIRSM